MYLQADIVDDIRESFEENSEIELKDFLLVGNLFSVFFIHICRVICGRWVKHKIDNYVVCTFLLIRNYHV